MKKIILFIVPIILLSLAIVVSCSKGEETGACTISCGGVGTGKPFFWKNHPFKTQEECREMGEERGKGCKASYCPPTGNDDDCFQVWP